MEAEADLVCHLYRASKLDIDPELVYDGDKMNSDWWCFDEEDYAKLPPAMAEKCLKLKVKTVCYDMKKILKENGFENDVPIMVGGSVRDMYTVFIVLPDREKEIGIKIYDEDLWKYTSFRTDQSYVCKLTELKFQEIMHVQNWGLVPENYEFCGEKRRVEKLCEQGGLDKEFIELWVDGETFLRVLH